MIGWAILGCLLTAVAIYLGVRMERLRVQADTDKSIAMAKEAVEASRNEVAGMDEDEINSLVFGPDSDSTPINGLHRTDPADGGR